MDRFAASRQAFRAGLRGATPIVAVGAHDAMTASLIEQHGFDAVWVSGFGVATMAHAVPDLNVVTMTEALDAARRIRAATSLPVIADCDNGFGGLLNVVRTVQEYERAGITAVCIEDNFFPKRNSLLGSDTARALLPVEEQARRLRAAKERQETVSFAIIARVEALIAGLGVEEACRRADAYVEAGVDAILIHSRDKTLGEINGFLEQWNGTGTVPLVCVPTLFPSFTIEELGARGFNMVIFANQPMRAAIRSVEDTLRALRDHKRASVVDPEIAAVNYVFDLVGTKAAIRLDEGEPAAVADGEPTADPDGEPTADPDGEPTADPDGQPAKARRPAVPPRVPRRPRRRSSDLEPAGSGSDPLQ